MRWPSEGAPSPREAIELQRDLAARVSRTKRSATPKTIAGVDVGVRDDLASAAWCVFSFPDLELLDRAAVVRRVEFPYVPGLLGFREVPALALAFRKLRVRPDVALVDGQGIAHPRRLGVASHLGVELDLATVGCAKSLLVGEFREPAARRGASTRLVHDGELIGRVVRTRSAVAPVFVSIGHAIDLGSAVALVLRCTRGYRLPEPIRAAHSLAAAAASD